MSPVIQMVVGKAPPAAHTGRIRQGINAARSRLSAGIMAQISGAGH
jgi:hypothetical protein